MGYFLWLLEIVGLNVQFDISYVSHQIYFTLHGNYIFPILCVVYLSSQTADQMYHKHLWNTNPTDWR